MTVEQLLEKYFIITGKVTIHGDIVDVAGNVKLKELYQISKLPVQFGTVTGNFICSYNKLTTLEGAPHTVSGKFYCYDNKLTSLVGAPQSVGGDFHCGDNQLKSLEGAPQSVTGDFDCTLNKLKSLQGAPQSVSGKFSCDANHLTNLEGAPQSVGGSFGCTRNPLTSLQGLPLSVGVFATHYNETLGLLKLITNNIEQIFIASAPDEVFYIMNQYRKKANSVSQEHRNALAVKCALELIRAGYKNNARL